MKWKKTLRNGILAIHRTLFSREYFRVIELIKPEIFLYSKKTLGKTGDGSYIVPYDLIQRMDDRVLLSFGVSDDISFEEDFKKLFPKSRILAFDPTLSSFPKCKEEVLFFNMGLSGRNNEKKKVIYHSRNIQQM